MLVISVRFVTANLTSRSCVISRHSETIALVVDSEQALLRGVSEVVRAYDPDILMGFEVQKASWGYMIARGKYVRD